MIEREEPRRTNSSSGPTAARSPARTALSRFKYVWIGVALAIVSWLLESYVHVVLFRFGDFRSEFLNVEPHELWKRLVIASLLFSFGIYAQHGIDARRRTELALQASETKHRTLIAEALNPVFVLDGEGRILECNRAAREFLEVDDEALAQARYQDLFWSPDPEVQRELLAVNPGQHEVSYLVGGASKTLLLNVVPFAAPDGSRLYFGIGQDFTERKRMQDRLEYAHAELQQIFQTASAAMRVIDADHNVIRVNDAFVALSGIRREEAIGAKCFEVLPGDKCHTSDCPIDRILAGAREVKYPLSKSRSDGGVVSCLLTARPFLGAGGKPVGIVESFNDITALAEAQEELRGERDRLRHLLFQGPAGLAIIRRDHVIEFENATLVEEFGSSRGRNCFEALRGRSFPCQHCELELAIESGQLQRREQGLSGGRVVEHVYTPFRDANGEEKVLVLVRDITERKASRASVIREEQLAALGELAAGVAHEINNPMNGIINCAQMLINRERDPAEVRAIAGRMVSEGDRIAKIVESLLAFARRESQVRVPTRVDELLGDSLTLIGAQIRKDAISLEVAIPPDLPRIVCVPQEVQQVFLNILSNSRYALNERYPDGHENKQLRITAAVDATGLARSVVVTFEDHGVGIPSASLNQVTHPFFTTKPKGKGTGLGLSICQEILRECGGRLAIESVEGEFTKVMVSLPQLAAA